MTRGQIKELTSQDAINRARAIASLARSVYKLGAGGKYPNAPVPFSMLDEIYGCDCIGFVCWCLGLDRFQEKLFPAYEGWINTDSVLIDARTYRSLFKLTDQPQPGDIVVYPGLHDVKGNRTRIGHVAFIDEVTFDTSNWTANLWNRPASERKNFLEHIKVIDCSANWKRKLQGRAVQHTTAAKGGWNKPDARFVRYRGYKPNTISALLVNGRKVA